MEKSNRQHKNSVFTLLFSDKERLISLYNAVSGANYGPDADIKINTLEDALFMDRINDISFEIGGKYVVLIEHQSTKNRNLPLRCLLYIARIYEKVLDGGNVYKENLIKIPTPEFIVCYNGEQELTDEDRELKLSHAFIDGNKLNLELKVKVIDVNEGRDVHVLRQCRPLEEYAQFIAAVRNYNREHKNLSAALKEAVKYCINEGILAEFLSLHGSEVDNMLFTEFNLDDAKKVWREECYEEGIEVGIEVGIKTGIEAGVRKVALKLLSLGKTIEEIIESTELTEEQIKDLQTNQ